MAIGKFHGVMMPTTPTASRVISTPTPGRTLRHDLAGQAQRFAGEEIEDLARRGWSRRCPRPASCLPRAPAARPSSSLRARISSRGLLQDGVALPADRSATMPETPPWPRRWRCLASLGAGRGIVADDVVGVRRVDVAGAGVADPFAIDEVLSKLRHILVFPAGWPRGGICLNWYLPDKCLAGKHALTGSPRQKSPGLPLRRSAWRRQRPSKANPANIHGPPPRLKRIALYRYVHSLDLPDAACHASC